ncbi:hypothetical protein ACTXGK_02335 [Psychrobacter sp. T6-5]|uniref:hypothetical protein n=1 Tax=Psychrobacter sp. T6-5 TaxID=3457451 RepID=UPI003FD438EF
MPTTASINLPTPKSWDEFEDICLSAIKIKCDSVNFNRYGRSGQKQDGVDIVGTDSFGRLIGVQCKNTLNSLTEKLIVKEISKAESFTPPLSVLYIATSRPPDTHVQGFIQEISRERVARGNFAVGILFWTDIEQELSKRTDELKRFYPQFSFDTGTSIPSYKSERDKDISVLSDLFNCIDMDAIPHYLDDAPKRVHVSFLGHVSNINMAINSPLFQLYDKNIEGKIGIWIQKWFDIYSLISKDYYSFYVSIPDASEILFKWSEDSCRKLEERQLFENISRYKNDFLELHYELCEFIHNNYPEIDLNSTSSFARQFYI